MGEGEWTAAKHGWRGQSGWKKLHLGVDRRGVIAAHVLTDQTVDDATTGVNLIGGGRRCHCAPHGGRTLRHDRVLRDGGRAWREGRHSTDQAGLRVSTETAINRPRSYDKESAGDRAAAVEVGVGLPSAGPCGERLLRVQVDHRGWSSSVQSSRARDGNRSRLQHPQSDDRAWQASVVQYWSLKGGFGWDRCGPVPIHAPTPSANPMSLMLSRTITCVTPFWGVGT